MFTNCTNTFMPFEVTTCIADKKEFCQVGELVWV